MKEITMFDENVTLFCHRVYNAYFSSANKDVNKAIEIACHKTDDMSDAECEAGIRQFKRMLKNPRAMEMAKDVWG